MSSSIMSSSIILNRPWLFRNQKESLLNTLSKKFSLPRSITAFLINRGLIDENQIESHLYVSLKRLNDPFLMKDMDKATNLLTKAIFSRKKIGIFGDFDADGVTATALVYLFLKEIGIECSYYIPHRENEGYGLNKDGIEYLINKGVELIVTVDCGITNFEEVAFAEERGIPVIVTDHHEPLDNIPGATACINPKIKGCSFPFKDLSGVAVAFNLIRALRTALYKRGFFKKDVPNLKKYLDLVAIGTVSDMMPLFEDNRIFVKVGLEVLATKERLGLKYLMDFCGINNFNLSCFDIAFKLGPRINAAGRMSHAIEAFELLIEHDENRAKELAKRLCDLNQKRQQHEKSIFLEVMKKIEESGKKDAYIFYNTNWPKGILGLVASKVVQEVERPVLLLKDEGEELKGSGRVPDGFDLFSILCKCEDSLKRFGGHKVAAGLSINRQKLEFFIEVFLQAVSQQAAQKELSPCLNIDARIDLEEMLDANYLKFFELLEPFGPGYEGPLFATDNFKIQSLKRIGNGQNHLKFVIAPKKSHLNGGLELVAWGVGKLLSEKWHDMELAFSPQINEWQGKRQLQLILKDARKK